MTPHAPSRDAFELAAHSALREAYGPDAEFRDGQLSAIEALVVDRNRMLVVQRTGWGKSIVYLVATRLLRDAGSGPTIIVSPLLALMRDQIEAANRLGVRATTLNSSNQENWPAIERELLDGSVDLLLVSPERLNNQSFREQLLIPLTERAGLFVIDEAHCISDWGHDFRPDYRRITRVLRLLPGDVPVLCTTATANDRVVEDIRSQLGVEMQVSRGPLDRESLSLSALRLDTQAERLAWLAERIPRVDGTGIVYCLTVADAQRVAAWLVTKGIDAAAYSGQDDGDARIDIERRLRDNEIKVVCATSALGMGFDKPDLAFVIHFQSPASPVAYYQQVGRAGRSIPHALGVLLAGAEDGEIWDYFLRTSLPVQAQAEEVIAALETTREWMTLRELETSVNMSHGRLAALLKILDVDGAVETDRGRYQRTLTPWNFDHERIEWVRETRLAEQALMREYAETTECRMRFLRTVLDDQSSENCGRCDNCLGNTTVLTLQRDLVLEAQSFLRHQPATIEPRKRWVPPRSGSIPHDHQLQEGRALAYLNDAAYGQELLDAKRSHQFVSHDLVAASAEFIREWLPDFEGTIVPAPSFEPDRALVPDFARRLAAALQIHFAEPLVKIRHTEPQKFMENSAQQLNNVLTAYEVRGPVPTGPILLVDDVSDSRWTMTVLADLLASAGGREIYPFTIAKTKG